MLTPLVTADLPSESDPIAMVVALAIRVAIFMILYLAREKRFKSKYNPSKRHEEDIRDWGGIGGDPIGPPKGN